MKNYKFWLIFFSILTAYSFQVFLHDFSMRPDYWLDNRPYVYERFYKYFNNMEFGNSDRIIVTDRVGSSAKYCKYYLGKKCNDKFVFNSFDLNENPNRDYTLYAGFVGEFLGSDFYNSFPQNSLESVANQKFTILDSFQLRDTIAYRYGDLIIIAKNNEKL